LNQRAPTAEPSMCAVAQKKQIKDSSAQLIAAAVMAPRFFVFLVD
jgi:hypothetical protein